MDAHFKKVKKQIIRDPANRDFTMRGIEPLFSGSAHSKIVIIGQAPGIHAQTSGIPWDDASGRNLRQWLGITDEQFYDADITALIPMDFYYPGTGKTGDLPPRKDFADTWHKQLLDSIQSDPLILLIGQYAQNYYLPNKEKTLTDTVRNYTKYINEGFLPLPHPSPRNNIWMKKNPWFKNEVIPLLQKRMKKALRD